MRFLLAIGFFLLAATAQAEKHKVLVELYTSQGCSSCPPADKYLTELAKRDDVIALALHVDYWDYIGWKDELADPAYSQRQSGFAHASGRTMIYTPQMIIAGQDHVVGSKRNEVLGLISKYGKNRQVVDLDISRQGDRLTIDATASQNGLPQMDVQVVRYIREQSVDIRRGENAGKQISYTNIVRSWSRVDGWNGRKAYNKTVKLAGDDPVVVIVQQSGYGKILAVAELR